MAEQESDISISPKQLGMALGVLIAFIGAIPVGLNHLFTGVRADPFTGSQGRALTHRVEELEHWRLKHMEWGRDRSIIQAEQDARQDAQIQELYKRIP